MISMVSWEQDVVSKTTLATHRAVARKALGGSVEASYLAFA